MRKGKGGRRVGPEREIGPGRFGPNGLDEVGPTRPRGRWAAQEIKERGWWAGLERKRENLCLFFFKHKHHLNYYFEFKQNLNFGCYKSYPLKKNLVLEIRIDWGTT